MHHICSPTFPPCFSLRLHISTHTYHKWKMVHIGYLYTLHHPSSPKSKTVTIHTLITLKDHLKHYFCLFLIYHQGYTANRTLQTCFNYQLNVQFLYSITICMLHYNPRHAPRINMPIFRRTNCIITVSGIVTLCKRLYSMADESRVCSHPAYCTAVCREWRYQILW